MKTVKVIIEKNKDGFWAHSTNVPVLISGYGETVEACKNNTMECIEVLKELDGNNGFPYREGEYEVVFNFDVESLLENYKGILTNAGFERLTGINQRQMQHYAAGIKKPRINQKKKIEEGLHRLGKELLAIEL